MKTSTYQLIPSTAFGSATGNYDGVSTTFSGIPQKAAAYYAKDKSLQTISWYLNGLQARLSIEATLDDDGTTSTNWTEIAYADGTVTPLTENVAVNLTGNYTWIRATITSFAAGSIQKVSMSY